MKKHNILGDALELSPEDEYTLLYNLETKLRLLIESKLSTISPYWWDECVPWKVKERVHKRKRSRELAPWFIIKHVKLSDLHYLGIRDYIEIITQPNNWKKMFRNIFQNEDFIREKLEALDNIRNKVMHFQPLSPDEKQLLKDYTEEILICVGNWENVNNRFAYPAEEAILRGKSEEALRILNEGLNQTVSKENPKGDRWLAFWKGRALEDLILYDEAESWYVYAKEGLLPHYKKMAEERLIEVSKKKELVEATCPNCGCRFKIAVAS